MKPINMKQTLEDTRTIKYFPEETYAFCKILAANVPDSEIQPEEFTEVATLAANALGRMDRHATEKSIAEIKPTESFVIPQDIPLRMNNISILYYARYIPQILDRLVPKDYAEELRELLDSYLGWHPTHQVVIESDDDILLDNYGVPECIAALDWWTTRIQLGDMGRYRNDRKKISKEFTEDEIRAFRLSLAHDICLEIRDYDSAVLRTGYRFDLNQALLRATKAAGMSYEQVLCQLPSKVLMTITDKTVSVIENGIEPPLVIWQKEPRRFADRFSRKNGN